MAYRYTTSYYYRSPFPVAIKWLLITNGVLFLLSQFNPRFFYYYFGLVPRLAAGRLMLWQFVTYMFLHGGFFHILFNMFALWMFGRDIEALWGGKRFLKYYFLTGIGAGVLTWVTSPTSLVPLIGASGAVFGILLAFGMLFPDRPVFIYFLFPIPARFLVVLFAIFELMASFRHTPDGIGHYAHLGGMLVGYLYLKGKLNPWPLVRTFFSGRRKRGFKIVDRAPRRPRQGIDRILDKISAHGIESLTPEERSALEDFSKDD